MQTVLTVNLYVCVCVCVCVCYQFISLMQRPWNKPYFHEGFNVLVLLKLYNRGVESMLYREACTLMDINVVDIIRNTSQYDAA